MSTTHAAVPTSRDYTTDAGPNGWVVMSAIILGIAGVMRIFDAIWAFQAHGQVSRNIEDAIFGHSLKTYGWIYLVVAAILILASIAVYMRSQAARWFGVVAAALGAISAIWWMPYYPVWGLTYIFLAALVVYGLSVHGGRDESV